MRSFAVATTVLAAVTAAVAQTNTTTGTGTGQNHVVVVGGSAGLVYTPNQLTAAVGDTVTFEFQSKNHTATQSTFANPCTHLVNTTSNQQGFNSGYVPVAANATQFPAWTIQITDAAPIWVYCAQTGHCAQGMVMAINAPSTGKTFDAFLAAAKGSTSNSTSSANGTTSSGTGSTGTGSSTGTASTTSGAVGFGAPSLAITIAASLALLVA